MSAQISAQLKLKSHFLCVIGFPPNTLSTSNIYPALTAI